MREGQKHSLSEAGVSSLSNPSIGKRNDDLSPQARTRTYRHAVVLFAGNRALAPE
jgi:hypothetical protein